jgi:hypothetical protein
MAEDVLHLESMACDLCTCSARSKKEKDCGGTQHKLMGEKKKNIDVYCVIFFFSLSLPLSLSCTSLYSVHGNIMYYCANCKRISCWIQACELFFKHFSDFVHWIQSVNIVTCSCMLFIRYDK